MERMKFLFRDSNERVPWREALIELIKADGNYLLITSAYFSLSVDETGISEAKFIMTKQNKDYLKAAFKIWISKKCVTRPYLHFCGGDFKVYCKAGMTAKEKKENEDKARKKKEAYIKFTDYIFDICEKYATESNKKIICVRRAINKNVFHAKIAIKMNTGNFVGEMYPTNAILVGSSNLSNAAFANTRFFNYESDLFFYKSEILPEEVKHDFDILINRINHGEALMKYGVSEGNKGTSSNVIDFEIENGAIDNIGNKIYKAVENLVESRELRDI